MFGMKRGWRQSWFRKPVPRSQRRAALHMTTLEDRTVPATFTVTSTADTGVGSLRAQIAAANAAAGADIINFDPAVFTSAKTILLTTGEIAITSDLTIDGPTAALTISGNSSSRIFNINGAGTLVVGIQDLTMTKAVTAGANDGGAIFIQDENVTLTNCTLTGNSSADAGGAIRQETGGSLTLINCTFTTNTATSSGGALSLPGTPTVNISNSTFASNFAVSGGAVNMFQGGSLTVTGSTFNFNQATGSLGGAIFLNGSFTNAFVRNTTIHSNLADTSGGGIALSSSSAGTLAIQNSTITGNGASGGDGGGIARTGGTALITTTSSIIFGNTASTTADDLFTGGQVTASRSLIGTKTGITTYSADTFTTLNLGVNPNLGNLQNNGGPTQTRLPNAGSIAIDNGSNPAVLATDQRGPGYLRQRGPAVDIGAVEVPADFVVTNANNSGTGSLRQAILDANTAIGIDKITFDPTFFSIPRTISMSTGEMLISEGLTIDGPDAALTINANNDSRIFRIEGTAPVGSTLRDLRLINGTVIGTNDGGAILVAGSGGVQTFTNLSFVSNKSADLGGALAVMTGSASVTVDGCEFDANTAATGGGIFLIGGASLTVRNSTLHHNSAAGQGGAISIFGTSAFTATNSTLSANTAATGGGISWNTAGNNNTLNNSTLTGNTATGGKGGGAYVFNGTTNFVSTIVSGNTGASGPDIFSNGTTNVNNSAIGSNTGFTLSGANNLAFGADLLLGPLADNGGNGPTHLPGVNSPVFSKGSNPTGASFDQRGTGFPRARGGSVDIGAVEVSQFIVVNTNSSGAGSLLQATLDANAASGHDTITFDPVVFTLTKTIIPSATLLLTDDTTIEGPAAKVTISGNLARRVVEVVGGQHYTFRNMTLTLGSAAGSGGAILIQADKDGTLTLDNCNFILNTASGGVGGAITTNGVVLTATDCSFSNNQTKLANMHGGAIFLASSSGTFIRCTFSGNTATGDGGAITISDPSPQQISFLDCTLSNNSAGNIGGGIYRSGSMSVFVIRNSTMSSNTASSYGGGIGWSSSNGTLTILNSTITNNTSNVAAGGGGVSIESGTGNLSIESSIISGNINAGAPDIDNPNTTSVKSSAIGDNLGWSKTDLGGNLPFQPHANLKLGVLANNGGPTLTHLPLTGSPLINAGSNPASLTTDQRGFPRSLSGAVDMGSAEFLNTVVKNNNDSGADSLRQIILDTNAIPGADTITFDPTVFATPQKITLTSGELILSDDVTISGPSAGVAISANQNGRVMRISSLADFVQLSHLTLRDGLLKTSGENGAGLMSETTSLTLMNCTITNNTITNFNAGGAGLYANVLKAHSITMIGCTVSGNSSFSFGGGISVGGNPLTMLIENSAIIGNSTDRDGGGMTVVNNGTITIRNSTMSGNVADDTGGWFWAPITGQAALIIQNSTITQNTAGNGGSAIDRDGSHGVTVESSILSGNVSPTNSDVTTPGSVAASTSLIGSKSGVATFIGDAFTDANIGVDPQLGPLADNGGPTQTHMPAITSKALSNGSNPASLTTDQRGAGFPRVRGSAIDIGAVEIPMLVVTNTNNSGTGSLRQALLDANAVVGADTIIFDPTDFATAKTISLTSGLPNITDSLSIQGTGAGLLTVERNAAASHFRVFTISGMNLAASFSDLTISGGKSATNGGGISAGANCILTLQNVVLSGNSAADNGGAINAGTNSTVTINNSSFTANTADNHGGAINLNLGTFTLENTTTSGNSANGSGGAVFIVGSADGVFRNVTISGNTVSGTGGGIAWDSTGGTVLVQNSTIVNNAASISGGGLHHNKGNGDFVVESSIFFGNTAPVSSDIHNPLNAGFVSLKNCLISTTAGLLFTDQGGNLIGVNPLLGPLANNGGATFTHLPAINSPVINTGSNPAGLMHDQRGLPREISVFADIGAVEVRKLVVMNTNDSGPGSLRQNIIDANAISGADTITFDPIAFATANTITLTSAQLPITDSVTITGPGGRVSVSGNNARRVFDINGALPLTVQLENLIMIDGATAGGGGAVRFADDNLTIINSTITSSVATGSSGGGIAGESSGASLTLIDTTVSNNLATKNSLFPTLGGSGGGVSLVSGSNLTVINSTISGNQTDLNGAGLAISGVSAVIRNSTISGNYAIQDGGGIAITGTSSLLIENSTFLGNDSGTLLNPGDGTAILAGSGVTIEIASSIVFRGSFLPGSEVIGTPGKVTATSSLIGSKFGIATFSGDAFTNANLGVNPLLGPLANNGGPTLTHLPAANSRAVNNGSNPTALTADQRGYTRVVGGAIDIGAVETRSFLVTNTNDGGAGSLRQAIFDTNSFTGADIIAFDPTVFNVPRTISVLTALPSISDMTMIEGAGKGLLTVRRDPTATAFGVFQFSSSALTAAIQDMTISGGSTTNSIAAGIHVLGSTLTLDRVAVTGNTATALAGGGIMAVSASLTVRDSTIADNSTNHNGGGINSAASFLTIERSTLSGNTAASRGGAIHLVSTGSLLLRSSTLSGNLASVGGGIDINALIGPVQIRNSTITANNASSTATGNAGGLIVATGTPAIEILSSVVSGNSTPNGHDVSASAFTINLGASAIGTSTAASKFNDLGGNLPFGLDPRLGPLADNGGPTLTHLPLSTSPLIAAGSNPDALTVDQRGLSRVVGVIDIGATEFNGIGFTVNGGASQRSRITTLKVNFTAPVDAATLTGLGAITLTRTAATALGTVGTVVQTGAAGASGRILVGPASGFTFSVTLTFDNADGSPASAGVEGTSLTDGRWQLAIPILGFTSTVNDIDLRRLYGDVDNNGTVDGSDFAAFGSSFGQTGTSPFDFDANGTIDGIDFAQFGGRFGISL